MTDEEKRDKIVHALQMALDAKKEGTLQELVTWLKAVTSLKIKNLVLAQEQIFTDRARAEGETKTADADKGDTFITELQGML